METDQRILDISARWIADLRPLRILWVAREEGTGNREQGTAGQRERPSQVRGNEEDLLAVFASHSNSQIQDPKSWTEPLAEDVRPGITRTSIDDLDRLDSSQTFDLAYCPCALVNLPVGLASTFLDELRLRCRFLIVGLRRSGKAFAPNDPSLWRRSDLAGRGLLDHVRCGERDLFLFRGGRDETKSTAGRVVYLSPNREIRGGVRVLYQHVDILNSIGIPAVLAVREKQNIPAAWFAWNPRHMVYGERAAIRTTARDTIVIPEFRFREVSKYQHVACRLLFVQNPGLCFEIDSWRQRGYDGVLTLGCPDGSKSKLHEFLDSRTDLPIVAVTNHYSDDPWGKASVERIPGRILCLPRKGPEFVQRLQKEFAGVVTVDNVPQARMAVEYALSDIYVHTGFPEGQPMPPIEAMLSGCIVCGFTGQGGLDVMRDGTTAYVAPQDGNYEQLAQSLRRALEDPHRETVRAAGQDLARGFHRSVAARELNQCYREWLPTLNARPRSRIGAVANRLFCVT